jgi:hypothetical protein
MCFSINTHLQRTGKPKVKTHNVVFYIAALVQYTDINLPMEYTAFLCPAKVKMEAHICLKCLVSIYQTIWCHNPKTTT